VRLQADALSDKTFRGRIKSIVPYPNEAKLYPVEIDLLDGQDLIAGLGLQVFFTNIATAPLLLVPRSALLDDFKNPSVFVINAQKQAKKKAIRIGKPIGAYMEVLEGLQAKDLVITKGHHNVAPDKALANFKIVR